VLELAPELASGDRPAELNDREIRGLRLSCNRLSILAACESGLAPGAYRSVFADGLAASFLHAGSACVIGTLWPVEAGSTKRVVEQILKTQSPLHRGTARLSPAQALRLAQIELRDSGLEPGSAKEAARAGSLLHLRIGGGTASVVAVDRLSKLFFWAAFTCLGG
jgi:CHAT domain-containing protein